MGWLRNILGGSAPKSAQLAVLKEIQAKFSVFRALLDQHNKVIKNISRLEERLQNRRQIDMQSVRAEFAGIQDGVGEIIDRMIELGGPKYATLRSRFDAIAKDVGSLLPRARPVEKDEFIIPFFRLNKDRAFSVGAKNANLGEMKSVIGLPVPDGFAISAWAYKYFIETNRLQERINRLFAQVHIRRYEDMAVISDEIREMVILREIPEDLASAIYAAFDDLAARHPDSRFALRSSAMGEDTSFTFAGQYLSFLNVRRDKLLARYKEILASKFTPSAIYYLLSHALYEADLAMGAACMELVDASASGVVYTRDPVNPSGSYILMNSIFGLGSYLVEGVLTPDVFHVSRENKEITFSRLAHKPVKLTASQEGVMEAPVPESDREKPSLNEEQLSLLAEYALKIEKHYGEPQDIEWAADQAGRIFLIQTRPLKIPKPRPVIPVPEEMRAKILLDSGVTICPGAGAGPVFHISSLSDLDKVPSGVVLVAPNPSPALVTVMHKIVALITLVGGSASHMATLAREYSLPTIAGIPKAANLAPNRTITVDATNGKIYDGDFPEWVSAQKEAPEAPENGTLDKSAEEIIERITHLTAIHPNDPNFTAENCHSMQDIARFIHQKSMEEMFSSFRKTSHKDYIGLRLKTKIPLLINIIYLDRDYMGNRKKKWVAEDEIESLPMNALWGGILEEGWPSRPAPSDLKGFLAVVGSNITEGNQPEFSENSYAFLSKEYMLLSLRMGYHFQTIEAMATDEPGKNYVRMQFKLGHGGHGNPPIALAILREPDDMGGVHVGERVQQVLGHIRNRAAGVFLLESSDVWRGCPLRGVPG